MQAACDSCACIPTIYQASARPSQQIVWLTLIGRNHGVPASWQRWRWPPACARSASGLAQHDAERRPRPNSPHPYHHEADARGADRAGAVAGRVLVAALDAAPGGPACTPVTPADRPNFRAAGAGATARSLPTGRGARRLSAADAPAEADFAAAKAAFLKE